MIRLITFCVISLAFALIARAQTSENSCDHVECPPTPKHYEEFNCVPMRDANATSSCCPTHFDCSAALNSRNSSLCQFGNKTYKAKELLHSEELEGSCTVNCFCREGNQHESAKFVCAHIDCPEFFGYHHESEDGSGETKPGKKCVKQYKTNGCCSTGTVCGEELLNLTTCEYGGKTYYEGERIDTDGLCYSCLCGPNFTNGSLADNPNCHKINCNMQLHYQTKIDDGCIPVYLDNDQCCPIMWRCPDEETVVVAAKTIDNDSLHKCKFGNLTMNVGDALSPENEYDTCTLCECKTPPMAHCIQTC